MSANKTRKDGALGRWRDFLKTGALAVAGMMLPAGCSKIPGMLAPKSSKRPNIILIFTDDQNANVMGYASNGIVKTPNLDRLAAEWNDFPERLLQRHDVQPLRH